VQPADVPSSSWEPVVPFYQVTQCNEEVQCINIENILINTPVWYAPTDPDKDGEESPRTLVCSEVGDDQMDRGQAFLPESSGFAVVRIERKITDSEGKFCSYN